MGIRSFWNSACTKFWLNVWGTDVNDVKSQFLHSAVRHKDTDLIEYLIGREINVNLLNAQGKSALHNTVAAADLDMASYLLERSADANVLDSDEYSPLYYALHKNEGPIAEKLLSSGALFDPSLKGHNTLLHHAAKNGHLDAIKILLKIGADANHPNPYGNIPAYYTLANSDLESFSLLAPVTDLSFINPITGKTLLHTAASNGLKSAVDTLIAAHADLSRIANDGHSPIGEAIINGHTKIANALVDAGGVFDVEIEGAELINKAAANGHTRAIEYLLDFGVNINAYDSKGNIPIYYANTNDMLDFLCRKGAIVDFKDSHGYTSLHKAARVGDAEKVKILLKHGANPDTASDDWVDKSGHTVEGTSALYDALRIGHSGKVAGILFHSIDSSKQRGEFIIKSKIMGNDIITDAAKNGYDSVIDFYYDIKSYSKPDLTDTIYHALHNNRPKTAHKLESLGAMFNTTAQKYIELLHNAVKHSWYETAEKLLKLGVNPDAWDAYYPSYGQPINHTPLYYAIEAADSKMVNTLLYYKANPNATDPYTKQHSVYHAVSKGSLEIFKALVDKGAGLHGVDLTAGQTPLILAIKLASQGSIFSSPAKYESIIDIILSHSKVNSRSDFYYLTNSEKQIVTGLNKVDPASGKNALQLAISFGQVNTAKKLLEHKFVDVDFKSEFQEILKLSSTENKVILTKALIDRPWLNIEINKQYFDGGQTLLHKAAESGCVELVELFIGRGASLSIKDNNGYTPSDIAMNKHYQDSFIAKLMEPDHTPPAPKAAGTTYTPNYTPSSPPPSPDAGFKPYTSTPSAPPIEPTPIPVPSMQTPFEEFSSLIDKEKDERKIMEVLRSVDIKHINSKCFPNDQTLLHKAAAAENGELIINCIKKLDNKTYVEGLEIKDRDGLIPQDIGIDTNKSIDVLILLTPKVHNAANIEHSDSNDDSTAGAFLHKPHLDVSQYSEFDHG